MAAVAISRTFRLFLVVLLVLAGGCTRLPVVDRTPLTPQSAAELHGYLRSHTADVDLFRPRGPFAVDERKNHELRLSGTERIATDLFLSAAPAEKLPLVIFLHGYDSSKEAHANQALHLASWGVHCLTLQLPKQGPWVGHGRTLARVASFIRRSPESIDKRIDVDKIILVGHSFGASSVAIALAEGAPAAAGILLDPAAVGRELPAYLQRIKKPVMVIGADEEEVSSARNREYFYRFVRGGIAEVSIRDASHEDAQYPSEFSLRNYGLDPHTTEELQITFVAALTSATLSLTSTGTLRLCLGELERRPEERQVL